MLRQLAEQANGRRLHVAVFHADAPDEAEELRQSIARQFDCIELYVTEMTPVMGAHTGPGVLGLAFYADQAV
jgi:fatty acid-binding protein DegV